MTNRFRCVVRNGAVLLALALVISLAARVHALTNGQPASLVLGQPGFTSGATATTNSGMHDPGSIAIDSASGKVFVADSGNNRVLRFASGIALANGAAAEAVIGQPGFTTSAAATTNSGMDTPEGVAVDGAGRLWVADAGNSRVLRFDNVAALANGAGANGVLGQADFTSNAAATTQRGMYFPRGVAADGAGHLWVADFDNSRVLRFDNAATRANGALADGVLGQGAFLTNAAAATQRGMYSPIGVVVDSAGRLWVADAGNNRVLRFDNAAIRANGDGASGVLGQPDFITSIVATAQGAMNGPHGVAVDSAGHVWVADTSNSRVLWFDNAAALANGAGANGVLGQADFISSAQAATQSGMRNPHGVVVDNAGRLWVADAGNSRLLRFDKTPQMIAFGLLPDKTVGDAPFQLSATGGASGQPVTFTSTMPTVCKVAGSTTTIMTAGTCTIAADQAGNTDYQAAPQVTRSFTVKPATGGSSTFTNGQSASLVLGQPDFITSIEDTTQRGMNHPSGIAIDPASGKVFVADTNNNRVLRFASIAALANGAAAEVVIGQPDFATKTAGTTNSVMNGPQGLAMDNGGHLWVADANNNRVVCFYGAASVPNGPAANIVLGQPDYTSSDPINPLSANGMYFPFGVAVDNGGHLWVADANNNRVLRFDDAINLDNGAPADGVLGQPDFTTSTKATTQNGLFYPNGVAVDSTGSLWVADTDNSRVLRFDNAAARDNGAGANGVLGQGDFTTSDKATTQRGMSDPEGVAVDSSGRLWVTDTVNSRVLWFDNAAALASGAGANSVLGQSNFITGLFDTTQTAMHYPRGVAVDRGGKLWVADNNNNRALRFNQTTEVYLPLVVR